MSNNVREKYPFLEVKTLMINDVEVIKKDFYTLVLAVITDLKIFVLKLSFNDGESFSLMIRFPALNQISLTGSLSDISLYLRNLENVELSRLPIFDDVVIKCSRHDIKFEFIGSTDDILYFQLTIDGVLSSSKRPKLKKRAMDTVEEVESFIHSVTNTQRKKEVSSNVGNTSESVITIDDGFDSTRLVEIHKSSINIT